MSPVDVVLAFCLAFAGDVVWVHSVRATTERRAGSAAVYSMLMAGLGLATVALLVMTSWALALPAIAGHGLGTYLGVARET